MSFRLSSYSKNLCYWSKGMKISESDVHSLILLLDLWMQRLIVVAVVRKYGQKGKVL